MADDSQILAQNNYRHCLSILLCLHSFPWAVVITGLPGHHVSYRAASQDEREAGVGP